MAWNEIHIITEAEHVEAITDILSAHDALAITTEDAGDEAQFEVTLTTKPRWENTKIIGLFDAETELTPALIDLKASNKTATLMINSVDDQDWQRKCLDQFKPMLFGNRLWVVPTWCEPPTPDALYLRLDPGQAFGTGTHPTTEMCLEWLDLNLAPYSRVIDYGCGSGILGIAALRLGALNVAAIDYDPQALTSTISNAQQNNIDTQQLQTYLPDEYALGPADLVIANILAEPLIQLAATLNALVRPGGTLLLSGILSDQALRVKSAYAPWFTFGEQQEKDQWVRLVATKALTLK